MQKCAVLVTFFFLASFGPKIEIVQVGLSRGGGGRYSAARVLFLSLFFFFLPHDPHSFFNALTTRLGTAIFEASVREQPEYTFSHEG